MARTMFPFDDSYRVTFEGAFLPSQNVFGEIESPTVPDPRYKVFPLDKAPRVALWRQKNSESSESTTSSPSPKVSPDEPEKKIERFQGVRDDETNGKGCAKLVDALSKESSTKGTTSNPSKYPSLPKGGSKSG